ncbi:MAG: hypothetical protein PCFJNLEI_02528 [Verrucomicrobiae bacterium]|nr:hypothetical protein [Verrucomicrobiae bacterium]
MKYDRRLGLAVITASLAAIVVCWPCLRGGVLSNMDDDVYLEKAREAGGITARGLRWAFTEVEPYYQPLVRGSHLLVYTISGTNPVGHHAVNLGLHVLNTLLVVLLAYQLLPGGVAWLAGVLFAVHPLQAESVAWISGRTQLLCGAFMLGAALAYLKAEQSGQRKWLWLVATFYMLGWLCKPIVATLPLVLLVLDWFPLRRHVGLSWWRLLREKLWMFAVTALMAPLTYVFAQRSGMAVDTGELGWLERVLVAGRAVVFYLWKFVWPAWLSPFYPLPGEVRAGNPDFWVPIPLLVIFGIAIWRWRQRLPALAAAWFVYLALLLPVLGLTQFGYQSAANRHMYLAMIPLVLLVVGGAGRFWERLAGGGRVGLAVLTLGGVFALGIRCHAAVSMWRDDETLWRNVLHWYPDYGVANLKVAHAAVAKRDFVTARRCAERAAVAWPDNVEVQGLLGLVCLKDGDAPAAIRVLLPLAERTDVWLPLARYNLASAYVRVGSNAAAVVELGKVMAREPQFREIARRDRELVALRSDERFLQLLQTTSGEEEP